MKSHYLIPALLLLMVSHLKAQNDANLYDSWKSNYINTSWYFSDRIDDDVDRGGVSNQMFHTINPCCTCKTVMGFTFDWKSKNGKIQLYYNINNSSLKVDVINKPGTSSEKIAWAKESCKVIADESFAEFKRTFKLDAEIPYYISGTTLNLGGDSYYAVSGVAKIPQQTKVEYKEQPAPAAEEKKATVVTPAKKNGYHTQVWESGTRYEGEWKEDFWHGQGTLTFTDGEKYTGQWQNGLKHGQGTYTWANGNKYTGEYKNEMREGYGTQINTSGGKYTGQWLKNKMHGQGTYIWSDGSSYNGQWENNVQHGQGTFIWPSGGSYTGQWVNDQMHGQGTYTNEKGESFTGEYSKGEFVK